MKRSTLMALALGLTLPLMAHASSSKPWDSPWDDVAVFDLSGDRSDQFEDYTWEDDADELEGTKKVLLTDFVVEFENGYEHRDDTAHAYASLEGLSTEGRQKLTDQLYEQVVADLTALGWEVVAPNQLTDNPDYQATIKEAVATPYHYETSLSVDKDESWSRSSMLYSPHGFPLYLPAPDQRGQRGIGEGGIMGNLFGSVGVQVYHHEQELADNQKVPVLKVWIAVGFGDAMAEHSMFGSKAYAHPHILLRGGEETRLAFRTVDASANTMSGGKRPGDGSSIVALDQDVVADADYLAKPPSSPDAGHFVFTADEAKYDAIVVKYFAAVREMLLLRLKDEAF
ncbi:MAG: hypothetical protein COX57_03910 [Alphaproteobacteria bacterium CG_4_10_14_0_2_um_filter_63_37]|nr:MAG: hypothetical protein AUJ55_02210 [Proteobacteria bacterium CG1_02_64_396]PJA25324.1 MAG: hypothetical protein COX57_03910 [Alphaproteobacteria bacterium CG_4_10_14_0_2_um_filter_63_37]